LAETDTYSEILNYGLDEVVPYIRKWLEKDYSY